MNIRYVYDEISLIQAHGISINILRSSAMFFLEKPSVLKFFLVPINAETSIHRKIENGANVCNIVQAWPLASVRWF
jgi:hypothetical protein